MIRFKTKWKARAALTKTGAPALLLMVLLLSVLVVTPFAQDENLDNEALATEPEAVVLEQTTSPGTVNTIIEIPASQDTYVASNRPNQNFGGDSSLRIGYDLQGANYGALRTFIQFDVARYVPAQAVINSATLRMNQHASSPLYDSPMRVTGRQLLRAWDEYALTWNSHEPGWGAATDPVSISTALGWHEVDVTGLAREWYGQPGANYGLIALGDEHVQERERVFSSLNANNGLYPRLVVDYTQHTDPTPPTASVNPLPTWSQSNFLVTWSGTDHGGSGIAWYDVRYRRPGGYWIDWQMHTTATSAQFVGGENDHTYEFTARAVDHAGNVQAWGTAQADTKVDSIAPNASVNPLPGYTFVQSFDVSWTGSDNAGGSGIAFYDIQWQKDGGAWQDWLIHTTSTSALFTGARDDGTYGFRARATDVAGNVQPYTYVAQAATHVETSGPHAWVLPFDPSITKNDSFLVQWTGSTAPDLSIDYFDVRYQFNAGPWESWLDRTTATSATFHVPNPEDGVYGFEARAKDSAGRLEPWKGVMQAGINVDRHPPFMAPRIWLPLVPNKYFP